ncbi:MAG TPA: hypothetical protein VM286_06350 [Candidatus Thermoplasmatota archaeon]|nr:hypothetical protein [Candidatus Thermoplasmatota archaeon]
MLDPRWVVSDGRHRFLASRAQASWAPDIGRAIVFHEYWDAVACQQAAGGLILPWSLAMQVAAGTTGTTGADAMDALA